jgi:hypothetical protein
MAVGQGFKSYIAIGKETTFGVAATVTQKFEMASWSVAPVVGSIPDPSLYSGQSRRGVFESGKSYRGTFVVRLVYDGLLELFRAVHGSGVSGAPITGSTRDHTFKEAAALPSYTIEAIVGDIPTGKCFQLLGAKFMAATVRSTAGQGTDAMVQAEFTVIAKDMISNATPTNPGSFPALLPVLFHQASQIDDGVSTMSVVKGVMSFPASVPTFTRVGGSNTTDLIVAGMEVTGIGVALNTTVSSVTSTTVLILSAATTPTTGNLTLTFNKTNAQGYMRLRSFEVTLENPHDEARYFMGSLNPDEALRNDFIVARWRFVEEFTSIAAYDLARVWAASGSEPSPRLIFQHPTAIDTTYYREFEMRSNKCNITEFSAPVEGYGVVLANVTLEAFNDPTDASGMLFRVRNQEAALV